MRRAALLIPGCALVIASFTTPLAAQSLRHEGTTTVFNGDWLARMPFDDVLELLRFTPGSLTLADHTSFSGLQPRFLLNDQPVSLLLSPTAALHLPLQAVDSLVVWRRAGHRDGLLEAGAPASYHLRPAAALKARLTALTDRAFGATSSGLTRVNGFVSGPVPFARSLRFALAGDLLGHTHGWAPVAEGGGRYYRLAGIDTMIRMPRASVTPGGADSVDVPIPRYAAWERNQLSPLGQDDRYSALAQIEAPLPRGTALLTFHRGRTQAVQKELVALFNPDASTGEVTTRNLVQLQVRSAFARGLTFDASATWQGLDVQRGLLASGNELHPSLGFRFSRLEFDFAKEDWPVTERLVRIARSGLLAAEDHRRAPGRGDLAASTAPAGVITPLNLNPWGAPVGFTTRNSGNVADTWSSDRQWAARGTLESRLLRGHVLAAGFDFAGATRQSRTVQLYDGIGSLLDIGARRAAVFAQDEFRAGRTHFVVGARLARYSPDAELPRVPGYVFNVPDSLSLGTYRLLPGEGNHYDRLVSNEDCGGEATAAWRRRPATNELVCKSNFVPMESRTELNFWSAAEWQPSPGLSLRASARQLDDASMDVSTMAAANSDLVFGGVNTTYPRDVQPERSRLLGIGGSLRLGSRVTVHVDLQQNSTRDGRMVERASFEDPVTGRPLYLSVTTAGADVDLRSATLVSSYSAPGATMALGYSYLDRELAADSGEIVFVPRIPPHSISLMLALTPEAWSKSAALRGTSIHAAFRARSGFSYRPLHNEANGIIAGESGTSYGFVAGGAEHSPLVKELNLRIDRSVLIANRRVGVFIDARNPLGFVTTRAVFAETGTSENELFRERFVHAQLTSPALDGDATVDDVVIASEGAPGNAVNRYMLRQAEARFGNGDGIFTVAEQRATYDDLYRLLSGVQQLEHDNRLLRIGVALEF